ncbi:putative G-protein coupled receptor 158 [Takifugu flavidus]|uniref:Putative G-protein coupled receptor 158 n=1 Tax=Takifugu flavidus TaxID=433684 RepID=A0A5C6P1W9_9TELE|nr:putative G-protein coupled receptor 158 [Takifugu flavidus]
MSAVSRGPFQPMTASADIALGERRMAEFLFLLWGVYLCYAVRTVPSAFHEPRYMAAAIYNELLISAIFHIIR